MAPRKQPTTRSGGPAKALTPKSTRVTKKTAAGALLRRSARVADQAPKDGLLDLRQTPEHLVAIAKRNAAESPLLRLPPEIRNNIWKLGLGGEYIRVPVSRDIPKQGLLRLSTVWQLNEKAVEQLAVFRIPSVSRQVYAETAALPYSTNTFVVGRYFQHTHASWSKALIPAYRDAIKTIVVIGLSRPTLGIDARYPRRWKLLTTHFPNLKTIEVTVTHVDWALQEFGPEQDSVVRMTRAERDNWVTAKLKKKHGEHLNVRVLAGDETKELEKVY